MLNEEEFEFIYSIPESIFFDSSLTIDHIRIYAIINYCKYMQWNSSPTNSGFSKYLNIHTRTIIRCINHLLKQGYIEKEKIEGRRHLSIKKRISYYLISPQDDFNFLYARRKYLLYDERTDEEFLRQCKYQLEEGIKNGYAKAQVIKGLHVIIRKGSFETPRGYDESKIIKGASCPAPSSQG